MQATELALSGLVLFEPAVFPDDRGLFFESFNARAFAAATGFAGGFVQDNQSLSRKGVLRGLHYQRDPHAQGKLVRVFAGRAYDVAVDIRRGSASFGQWAGVELSAQNRKQLWIPPGFAHGFLALEEGTELFYKVTAYWDRASERTIRWDDEALAIAWPLHELGGMAPVLSDKDAAGMGLATWRQSGEQFE